jgi:hypothetical protein
MKISRRRLKTGSIGFAMAIGLNMALLENVMAQNRWELFQNDWNVAVEQDKLAISKGCIDPEQKAFLISYTIMAGQGFNVHLRVGILRSPFQNPEEIEGHNLIDQLQALPPCDDYANGIVADPVPDTDDYANGIVEDPVPDTDPGTAIINPIRPPIFIDIIKTLTFMNDSGIVPDDAAWEIDPDVRNFTLQDDDAPDDATWEIDPDVRNFSYQDDAAVSGTAKNFLNNPMSGLWQSFHTVKEYFTTPNDSSSLGGRSWGVQDYGTLKNSKTQEVIQDVNTVPAKGDVIAPGQNPATPSVGSRAVGGGFFERKRELLEDAKGISGTGSSPAATGGRRQELLDEAKLTPSSGNASGIGSDHKQGLLEGSKGNSFNTKSSLEEKSFKNSGGEKTRSTFTGDKVLSQRGTSNSFAPLVGKTHTFSGTGTKPPTSGKSFKMHGF